MKTGNLHMSRSVRKFTARKSSKRVVLYDPSHRSVPDPPKIRTTKDTPLQSDSGHSFVYGREYRHLLRSCGHLFRDGRWLGDDDPFHVYRELENPGIGTRYTFSGGSYYRDFIVGDDPSLETYNWVPIVCRGYTAADSSDTYDTPLPDPTIPVPEDYTFTLNGLGTDFIRRFRPGNPVANLGEFIIELHDLPQLPRFLQSQAKRFADLGKEYLNVEFGWKPFISDLRKVTQLQMTLRDRLNKLVANNGIRIKRRSKHEFRTVSSSAVVSGRLSRPFGELSDTAIGGDAALGDLIVMGPVPFGYFDSFMQGDCLYELVPEHTTESWYVGTYYYYVPDIGSDQWTSRAIAELYGLSPHPAVIYKTYPWTWLSDWFLNVGDIVSNLSSNAVDSEALGGGYVMHKEVESLRVNITTRWDAFSYSLIGFANGSIVVPPGSSEMSYSLLKVNRMRRQASPFGMGLRPGDFTTRQSAILLALGVSSLRKPRRSLFTSPGIGLPESKYY